MSRIYFECRFKSYKLRSLDLPIEVRKSNLTLVTRCRSSQSVELKAGTYYLIARLPTEQELYSKIELAEGTDTLVILTSKEEDEASNALQEILYFLGDLQDTILRIGQQGSLDAVRNALASRRSGSVAAFLRALRDRLLPFINRTNQTELVIARLRLFRGNPLKDCSIVPTNDWLSPLEDGQPMARHSRHLKGIRWLSKSNASAAGEDLHVAQFSISGMNSPQLIQLLQPQMPPINVMLPVSVSYKCSLVLKQLPNGSCAIDIHLANTEADLLLRYLQEGLLTQGAVLAASEQQVLEAVHNLEWWDDPIAATVGAYALLRFNALAHLEGWTEKLLSSRFAWLPDGIAIRGEYLARIGEHTQVLTLFLDLPSRGLPVFSDGLSYIIDRLRLYTQYGEALFESEQLSQARSLLEQLQHMAFFVDFRQSLLTFNGIDPGKPEDNPREADISSYKGYDVATLLHPPHSKRRSLLAVIRDIHIRKVIASLSAYFAIYRASFLGVGVIIPAIAALVTLVLYLSFYLLSRLPFLSVLTGGWYALLCGIFFTGIVWGVLSTLYISFVSAEKANARSYRALKKRLHELESQLGISELQKKSLSSEERQKERLKAARVDPDEKDNLSTLSALDEAYTSYMRVSKEFEESSTDLRWMLGTGYIEAWKTLHHAEEALVQFTPVAPVIRGTIRTNVRIQRSSIGNRPQLLHISRQAVKNADSRVSLSKLATNEGDLSSNASFSEHQAMARVASRSARRVFNKYRDNLWQGLVRKRNQLLEQLLCTGIATYILLCIAIFISHPTTIIEATACYIFGSIAGLIRPLCRALKRNSAIDDYGFSWIYVLASCLFSGLMAVVGLLVLGRLDIPNISPVDLFVIWQPVFRLDELANLLIAAFFGLLSNLYFGGFVQKAEKIEYFEGLVQKVEKIESDLLQSNPPPPSDLTLPIT